MNELQIVTSELKDIYPVEVKDQLSSEAAQRILHLRQFIMDKIMTIEETKARMSRHEASIEELEAKLQEDMPSYHKKDISARIQLAKVRHEWGRQVIIQCEMELCVYRKMLIGDR